MISKSTRVLLLLTVLPVFSSATAATELSAQEAVFEQVLKEFATPTGPGFTVGVSHKGKVLYTQAFGMADLEHGVKNTSSTVFHVASVSKMFTAFVFALLEYEKRIDLDEEVRTYLPYLSDFGSPITIRQLIYHTSGLRDQWALFALGGQGLENKLDQKQIVNMVKRQRALNFTPGTDISYSNTGYSLLAEIVPVVTGKTLRQFTQERVFKPLGMDSSFFYDDVSEIVRNRAHSYLENSNSEAQAWQRALLNYNNVGATSLHTTVMDMLKWAGNFARPTIASAELMKKYTTMGQLNDGTAINYGFGLYRQHIAGHSAILHTGVDAGFRSIFVHFPQEEFSVVILGNYISLPIDRMIEAIVDVYINKGKERDRQPVPAAMAVESSHLDKLVGYYQFINDRSTMEKDNRVLIVKRKGSSLHLSRATGGSLAVTFRTDTTFDFGDTARAGGRYFKAVFNGEGEVAALRRQDGDHIMKYEKVPAASPTAAELQTLVGSYRSPELDVTYEVSLENGHLLVNSIWFEGTATFIPTTAGKFEAVSMWSPILELFEAYPTLSFSRDRKGRVDALQISVDRVRDVRFDRVR